MAMRWLGSCAVGGIALYRVSPKRVHDAAEVYDGVPSLHDAKAALPHRSVASAEG